STHPYPCGNSEAHMPMLCSRQNIQKGAPAMQQEKQDNPIPDELIDPEEVEAAEFEDETEEVPFAHTTGNGFKSPFYQWSQKLAQVDRPDECIELSEQAYRELQVERCQPFRKAILDEQEIGLPLPRT